MKSRQTVPGSTLIIAIAIAAATISTCYSQVSAQESPVAKTSETGVTTVSPGDEKPSGEKSADEAAASEKAQWHEVDTANQDLWKSCQFGGDGELEFSSEAIRMGNGDPLTGVVCLAKLPNEDYEIEFESRRMSNFDFFCGLTFPVGEEKCSFIVGGWAGAVVGLSSIDGEDASENKTKKLMSFENEQWYRIRVRVTKDLVQAWIDDQLVVKQERAGHKFSIRAEMYSSLPVGIAAFHCEAELRKFRWRNWENN